MATLDRRYQYMSGVMLGDYWDETSDKTGCYFFASPKQNAHGIGVVKLNINHYAANTQLTSHMRIQRGTGRAFTTSTIWTSPFVPWRE